MLLFRKTKTIQGVNMGIPHNLKTNGFGIYYTNICVFQEINLQHNINRRSTRGQKWVFGVIKSETPQNALCIIKQINAGYNHYHVYVKDKI